MRPDAASTGSAPPRTPRPDPDAPRRRARPGHDPRRARGHDQPGRRAAPATPRVETEIVALRQLAAALRATLRPAPDEPDAGAGNAAGAAGTAGTADPVDAVDAVDAAALGRPPDRAFRDWLAAHYRDRDPRTVRYGELVAVLRGEPAQAGPSEEWSWLIAACRAHLAG